MRRGLFFLGAVWILFSCSKNNDRFRELSDGDTGIDFNNQIFETDSFNILTYEYIYNGGGVAIADFNNDGLQDVYFTGNMVSNALYLNRTQLEFENVTEKAGVTGEKKWCSGVAVVDINADGWQDMYVCTTQNPDPNKRKNILSGWRFGCFSRHQQNDQWQNGQCL